MNDQIVDMLAGVQGRVISEADLRRLIDEAARLKTEIELDRNRFMLIASLIARGDTKGAAATADVAITRLRKVLDPSTGEPAPS